MGSDEFTAGGGQGHVAEDAGRSRECFRKGCGCRYQPKTRFCGQAECEDELHRWLAAKGGWSPWLAEEDAPGQDLTYGLRRCQQAACGAEFWARSPTQVYCSGCGTRVRREQARRRQERRRHRPGGRERHAAAERARRAAEQGAVATQAAPEQRAVATQESPKQRAVATQQVPEQRAVVTQAAPEQRAAVTQEAPELGTRERGHASHETCQRRPLCDRPGCYEPPRPSLRRRASYCGAECASAVRRVFDRERRWRARGLAGRRAGRPSIRAACRPLSTSARRDL